MPRVKVFNENVHPLVEIFKGQKVEIAPKDYWRNKDGSIYAMDFYEAVEFKGQYHPGDIDTNGMMVKDPKFYKMIRVEPVEEQKKNAEPPVVQQGHRCMVKGCTHLSPSPEELEAHNKVRHAGEHVAQGTAEGPLTVDPNAIHTRPTFEQFTASAGKEDAPSTTRGRKKSA